MGDSVPFESGDEIALIVNGLGGTPAMELFILNTSATDILKEKGYKTFVGNYMSSIDMAGASLTLFKLDDELKELLDSVRYSDFI